MLLVLTLLLLSSVNSGQGKRRENVNIFGTTVSPNFVRKEGTARNKCPVSHPFAYNSGSSCCQFPYRAADPTADLDVYDPLETCAHHNVNCPGKSKLCKTGETVSEERQDCPSSHPQALAGGTVCCSSYGRASNLSVPIEVTDPADECPASRNMSCPGLPKNRCQFPAAAPVHGKFSPWSAWTECTKVCGEGTQTRTRTCTHPAPTNGGNDCIGSASEADVCNAHPCCSAGWAYLESHSKCYKQVDTTMNSRDARNNCGLMGSNLASVHSTEENDFIKGLNPNSVDTWLGHVTGEATWFDGTGFGSFTSWHPNEPSSSPNSCAYYWGPYGLLWDDNEDCLGIFQSVCKKECCGEDTAVFGGWTTWASWSTCSDTICGSRNRTRTCTHPSPANGGGDCPGNGEESLSCGTAACCPAGWSFLEHTSSCYLQVTDLKAQSVAEAHCQTLGAHLVSLHSETENNFVESLNVARANTWIGYHTSDTTYTDGTPFGAFTDWYPGEPNNPDGACAYYRDVNGLSWDDHTTACEAQFQSVCKKHCCA